MHETVRSGALWNMAVRCGAQSNMGILSVDRCTH
jgi:hypothetical protein